MELLYYTEVTQMKNPLQMEIDNSRKAQISRELWALMMEEPTEENKKREEKLTEELFKIRREEIRIRKESTKNNPNLNGTP